MGEGALGPWVVVVGMHRSGTSAVTGAIGALGFNVVSADDRLSPHESNPEHWESLAVLLHNDAILEHFGATWDAPPRLAEGWEDERGLPDRATAARLLAAAYPHPGPSVWKDPRVCLLLPYWREVLGSPIAAVLVWRDPLAVAGSLQRRNGTSLPYGVALWERYNRSAVANVADVDTYVLDYDAMIDDPAASVSGLTSWLASTGTFDGMGPWDHERALSVVAAEMRHQLVGTADADDHVLLDEQRRLVEYFREVAGGHTMLPLPSWDESPWTEALFEAQRGSNPLELKKLEESNHQLDWYRDALAGSHAELQAAKAELHSARTDLQAARAEADGAQRDLATLKSSSSWKVTAPVRSVGTAWAARGRRRKE
jgi:hypothetical protein